LRIYKAELKLDEDHKQEGNDREEGTMQLGSIVSSVETIRGTLEKEKIGLISKELAVSIQSIESASTSASLGVSINITSGRAVVVLQIHSFEVVGTFVSHASALITASSSVETLFITALERFVTSKGLKSSITFRSYTSVARLYAEVLIQLLEEAVSFLVQVMVIVPSPSSIRNETSAEIKTLVAARTSENVAVLTSSPEGDGIGSVLSIYRNKVGIVSRMSSACRNLQIAHPGSVEVVGVTPDLLSPSGLKRTTMIANGDQNTLSFGHNNSPSHGLRFSRDRIVEVVIPIVILESTNTMMIGLKKNVITSLLNFKGIRHRVIHVRLNQRLNGDVELL
jgi:hypothetical protein